MNLITPDSGLLIWMTLIFLVILFIVVKFGFPVITDSVEKRTKRIDESLKQAREAEDRMKNLAKEQEKLIADTKLEQSRILKEAAEERRQIIDQAKTEIAAEKESAIREVRKEVALLSVKVAEKIVRKDLSSDEAQADYLNRLVDEMSASGNQHKTETNGWTEGS